MKRPFLSALALALIPLLSAAADEPPRKPLFRDFMGLNVHTVQFRPDLYKPVARRVRDYHPFGWDVGDESDHATTFPMARNGVDWKSLYGTWTRDGYGVDVCLMFDEMLPPKWRDLPRDAGRYGEAFARHFGPSGGKMVESVEIGNEPGKYDDASYRTLFEAAARGMRQGDPKLKVATCAVFARKSGDYHKNIDTVKGLNDLYDAISVHSYPELEPYPTWRRSFPEDPRLDFLRSIHEVVAWRDANAPGKEVWLTEFGWDSTTKPREKEGDFKDWAGGVTDAQQAQYLVRGFLTLAELDLERAYLFWFNDDDQARMHGSSGLTRGFTPKPSFHAVAHLLATLGDYRLSRVVRKVPDRLVALEFSHATDRTLSAVVAWSPTGSGRSGVERVPLPDGVSVVRAERMPMAAGAPEAVKASRLDSGEVEVEVGESPVYLLLKGRP